MDFEKSMKSLNAAFERHANEEHIARKQMEDYTGDERQQAIEEQYFRQRSEEAKLNLQNLRKKMKRNEDKITMSCQFQRNCLAMVSHLLVCSD